MQATLATLRVQLDITVYAVVYQQPNWFAVATRSIDTTVLARAGVQAVCHTRESLQFSESTATVLTEPSSTSHKGH